MKKLINKITSVALSIAMIFSGQMIITFADTPTQIEAENYINSYDIAENDYYGTEEGYENGTDVFKTHDNIVYVGMIGNEWLEYSYYASETNDYSIKLMTKNSYGANVSIACGEQTLTKSIKGSMGDVRFKEAYIGDLRLEQGNNIIRLSLNNNVAFCVDYIEIDKYPTPVVSDLKPQGVSKGNVAVITVPRATDFIDLEFNYSIKFKEEYSQKIKINNKETSVVRINDNTLRMQLLETLDYNASYTLTIEDIETQNGLFVSDKTVTINTSAQNSDEGSEKFTIISADITDGKFSVSGKVSSKDNSYGHGIKGRVVYADLLQADGTLVKEKCWQGLSLDEGEFSISYNMVDASGNELEGTTYKMRVYGDYAQSDADKCYTEPKVLIGAEGLNAIINAFNNADTASTMSKLLDGGEETILKQNIKKVLMLERFDLRSIIADEDALYAMMASERYTSVDDIINVFCTASVAVAINEASTADELETIFAKDEVEYVDFDNKIFDFIDSTHKTNFYTNVFLGKPYTVCSDFILKCTSEANMQFNNQFGNISNEIIVNNVSVNEAQQMDITISYKYQQKGLLKAIFELECGTALGSLLNNGTVTVAPSNLALSVVKNYENGKITVTLNNPTKVDIPLGTKVTLSIIADAEKIGTYSITLKNETSYNFESMGSDIYNQSQNKAINVNIIAAPQTDKVPDGFGSGTSGGSGGAGGSGGSGGGSTDKNKDDNKTNDNGDEISQELNIMDKVQQYEKAFTDLDSVPWAEEYILKLASKNIVGGRGEKVFDPNAVVTRAEYIKMLVLVTEIQDDNLDCEYGDVSKEDWFYKYIAAASAKGLVVGDENNNLNPNAGISRQDMAVMTYRAMMLMGKNVQLEDVNFADSNEISDYAQNAVCAMVSANIFNGVGENRFSAHGSSTRAMAATVCYRFLEFIGGIRK